MNSIEILGEDRFYWAKEDDRVVVNHPKWSAVGIAETLSDAIYDMINEALIMKDAYVEEPDSNLSEEAQKFKYWLAPIKRI